MKNTIKALCIALLLSGAAAKAEATHKTWADVADATLNDGTRELLKTAGTVGTGAFSGAVVGLLIDQAVHTQEQNQKLIALLGGAAATAYGYYYGEQHVVDAFGQDKVGLAKTSATVGFIAAVSKTLFGGSWLPKSSN